MCGLAGEVGWVNLKGMDGNQVYPWIDNLG